jgi:acyl-coenzyme A thioesterase PaaI-like protein
MAAVMDAKALNAFLAREFPQVAGSYRVEQVEDARLVARLVTAEEHLRPGGTVSGPSMFALADLGIYCAILARIGPVALASCASRSQGGICWPSAAC